MRPVRYGKTLSGETINKVLPRFEYFHQNMTILDIKKAMFKKIKLICKDEEKFENNDQELNESILLHIFDNLPMEQTG